jgi:hypothetical protein
MVQANNNNNLYSTIYLTIPPFFSSSARAFLKGVGVLGVGSTKLLLTL